MKTGKHVMAVAYICLLIRSFIYGMSVFFTGTLLENTDVMDVLALRFLISALTFSALVLFKVVRVSYKGKKMLPLVLAMVFEPIGYFIFETMGIDGTTTSVAGILAALAPIATIFFETLILRETTTKLQKLLITLGGLGGVILVVNAKSSGTNTVLGVIFMLVAVLSGVFFTIFSRKSSRQFTTIEITYAMTLVGAITFNGINVTRHVKMGTLHTYFEPFKNTDNLMGFLFLAILSSIVATSMSNYVLSKMQASIAAALGGISTLVTMGAGVILNNERLLWYHYISAALIIGVSTCIALLGKKGKNGLENY